MNDTRSRVSRILPGPAEAPLEGLYLGHRLPMRGTADRPFVYTNFISTLDGRISWENPQGRREVPPAAANPHDLRLYHELAAQADVLLTTSRHLRAVAAGRGGNMLRFGPHADELVAWRRANGLGDWPRIVAVSAALELPSFEDLAGLDPPITALCWGTPPDERTRAAEARGYDVRICGPGPGIDGGELIAATGPARTVYSIAGPAIHTALLRAGQLHRLYLTLVPKLLGGETVDGLTRGAYLDPSPCLSIREMWRDAAQPPGCGQLFLVLEPDQK